MKKKLVAIISVVAMLVTMIPATVFAQENSEKTIATAQDLAEAIASQEDGQTWTIKEGRYDLNDVCLEKYKDITPGTSGQSDWYFPITKSITIIGEGEVTLTSSVEKPNGVWSSQDFISVWADDVTIENVNIECKKEVNKAIEVMGKNFKLIDSTVIPVKDESGKVNSGSIYFNTSNVGEASLSGVEIHSWISANSSVVKDGIITLSGVTVDFTDNAYAGEEGYGVISENDVIKTDVPNALTVKVDSDIDIQGQVFDRIPDYSRVVLTENITVDDKIVISKSNVELDGSGNAINLSTDKAYSNEKPPVNSIIEVTGGNATVRDVTLNDSGQKAKHGVQFYNSMDSSLINVTVDGTAWTGILVNGSAVSMVDCKLNPAEGAYATIEYAMGESVTTVPSISLTNISTDGEFRIWADNATVEKVKNNSTGVTDENVVETIIGKISTNDNVSVKVSVETTSGESAVDTTIPSTKNPSTPSNPGGTVTPSVTKSRVAGDDRFETAIKVADKLKSELGVVKFNNIVVANSDEFADALSATALAADKDAPILVVNKNNESTVKTYIAKNLNKGGNVYIIGGTAVVSESFEKSLTNCKITRLGGSDRYETNLEVLKTLGVTGASDIMVASGLKYPDALSASATGNPVLLVGKTLTDNQKAYLATLGGNDDYYVIGGTAAVNATVMNQLNASKLGTVTRLGGDTRYETGLAVAEEFFTNARTVVIASGDDFPDGLTGGVLANAMNAPLMLVNQYNTDVAAYYVDDNSVRTVVAIGGTTVIPDATLNKVA